MEFMSAGTPAIAPDHTAMEEYVSPANSFVLRSSDEWTQWPHDGRGVLRCFTRRVDWDSLRRAFVESWAVATQDPARYRTMGRAATRALRAYCSEETVSQSLGRFLASWSGEDEAPSLQRSDAAPARSALTTVLEPLRSLADLIRARRRA
jgi:hypothetical protein